MKPNSERYHEVSKSEFGHEREGLSLLLEAVPDAAPYRVWTNFTFMDSQGHYNEVDALVVGRGRIHLVELKSWNGTFHGNEHRFEINGTNGRTTDFRHPNLTARNKAQKFADRLRKLIPTIEQSFRELGVHLTREDTRIPWVQETLFLHGDVVDSKLSESGAQNVFGRDGFSDQTGLPGISARLTEAPGNDLISEKRSRDVLESAINLITGTAQKKRKHLAGSWQLGEELEHDDDFRIRRAINTKHEEKGIAYVSNTDENDTQAIRLQRERQIEKSYSLLRSLNHDGIDRPIALEFMNDSDAPVLIYQDHPSYEALDMLPRSLQLTAQQQVEIILQVADAIAYAHSNNVVHRRLAPAAVLIDVPALRSPNPEVRVKVSRWSTVSAADPVSTSTATYLPTAASDAYDGFSVFLPPEGFRPGTDRRQAELFSVGALAYFIFSGDMPAPDTTRLLSRLREHQGLDLAASKASVEGKVRELILSITHPEPKLRTKKMVSGSRSKASAPKNPVSLFADSLRETTVERRSDDGDDPLNPTIGAVIADRFEVERVLGSGSTARGLRVIDHAAGGEKRVLKVGLSPDKTSALHAEAIAIRDLSRAIGDQKMSRHFVSLLDGPLHLPHDRTALLLSDCGDYTLNDSLQLLESSPKFFWESGEQLLDILVTLESTGIVHRDIKPSNVGTLTRGGKRRLMLFDFSLAETPLEDVRAGSPPYLDPFLVAKQQNRKQFDASAERYSVAVVLLKLATFDDPVYGDGSANPATLKDQSLTLNQQDLPDFLNSAQQQALTEFFRIALHGESKRRFLSAEEMRDAFTRIKALAEDGTELTANTRRVEKLTTTPTVTATPGISSFVSFRDQLVAFTGKKNSIIRRYVQQALSHTANSIADPFATAADYAAALSSSPQRIHQLPAELPKHWVQSDELISILEELGEEVLRTVRGFGGIATPEQLENTVSSVLHSDLEVQDSRTRQGVLRMVEIFLNHDEEVLHIVRRGRTWEHIAFATDPTLVTLPKALEDAAVLAVSDSQIQPASAVAKLTSTTAAKHLELNVSNLPVAASVLPELATFRSKKVALTSSGELYSTAISLPTMLRLVIHASTDSIARSSLKNLLAARFPQATNLELPESTQLTKLIQDVDPEFALDSSGRYVRRRPDTTTGLETKLPTRTKLTGPRPTETFSPWLRDLFGKLEPTLSSRDVRIITVPQGTTTSVVEALTSQYGATHVDLAGKILDDLHQKLSDHGQAEKFPPLLGLDTEFSRKDLNGPVRTTAERVLANAVRLDAQAVVFTDLSILARFDALDLLSSYTDIASSRNSRALWFVIPHKGSLDQNVSVEGVSLPLTSPSQIVRVADHARV